MLSLSQLMKFIYLFQVPHTVAEKVAGLKQKHSVNGLTKSPDRKVIGENLGRRFTEQLIVECRDNNILFVPLIPNTTNLRSPYTLQYSGH